MQTTRTRTQGFTLIEVLTVMGLLALLATILLPSFGSVQKRPHDVAALQCGQAVVTAQTVRFAESRTYALNIGQLGEDVAEACVNTEVAQDALGQTADGDGALSVAGTNWAFHVWSKGGSKTFYYNKDGGQRLQALN